MVFHNSVASVVISPLSFLILFIWIFSFLLDEPGQRFVNIVYSSKNQLLILLTVFLMSISFFSSLILLSPSFCWLQGFFVLLFSAALDIVLGCLFDVFLVSWSMIASINLPLRATFAESHRFWVVMFSLPLLSRNLFICFLISSKTSLLFSNVFFNLHYFVFFAIFFPL